MIRITDNPVRDAEIVQQDEGRYITCDVCGHRIYIPGDEDYYKFEDDIVCEDCVLYYVRKNFKKEAIG